MKCPKCGTESKKVSKFCGQCGAALPAEKPASAVKTAKPEASVPLWRPDWRWHLRALVAIFIVLVVVYFALSAFLSKVPEPYRMRDIPKEMTPWLKK